MAEIKQYNDTCPVCIENLEESYITLNCKHAYCVNCFVSLIDTYTDCLYCKKSFTFSDYYKNNKVLYHYFVNIFDEYYPLFQIFITNINYSFIFFTTLIIYILLTHIGIETFIYDYKIIYRIILYCFSVNYIFSIFILQDYVIIKYKRSLVKQIFCTTILSICNVLVLILYYYLLTLI